MPLDALHVLWYTGKEIVGLITRHRVGPAATGSSRLLQKENGMYDRTVADEKYRKKHKKKCNARSAAWKRLHPINLKRSRKIYREKCKKLIIEKAKKYRAKTVEQRKAYNAQYYKEHKEDYRRRLNGWRKDNPERAKIQIHNRRARKTQAGGSYTAEEWKALRKKHGFRCVCCGKRRKLVPDHVIPIAKGGTSDIKNIQPLCQPCNSHKGTRTIDYRRGPAQQ
jgi:5-methylcytosine-specific restriction endonuclease McrA